MKLIMYLGVMVALLSGSGCIIRGRGGVYEGSDRGYGYGHDRDYHYDRDHDRYYSRDGDQREHYRY